MPLPRNPKWPNVSVVEVLPFIWIMMYTVVYGKPPYFVEKNPGFLVISTRTNSAKGQLIDAGTSGVQDWLLQSDLVGQSSCGEARMAVQNS